MHFEIKWFENLIFEFINKNSYLNIYNQDCGSNEEQLVTVSQNG